MQVFEGYLQKHGTQKPCPEKSEHGFLAGNRFEATILWIPKCVVLADDREYRPTSKLAVPFIPR